MFLTQFAWFGAILAAVVFSSDVQADDGPSGFHVQQIDPNYSIKAFEGEGFKLHSASEMRQKAASPSRIPPAAKLRAWLSAAGLEQPQSWEPVEQGVFFVRATRRSLPDFKSAYPDLPPAGMARFYQIARDATGLTAEGAH